MFLLAKVWAWFHSPTALLLAKTHKQEADLATYAKLVDEQSRTIESLLESVRLWHHNHNQTREQARVLAVALLVSAGGKTRLSQEIVEAVKADSRLDVFTEEAPGALLVSIARTPKEEIS
jgi:hypothetical protein